MMEHTCPPTPATRVASTAQHPPAASHPRAAPSSSSTPAHPSSSGQGGFSLVEVSIVMAIVLLLAIIAIPTVRNYVIESRVPKVGEELARYIMHTRINAASGSATPYSGIAMSSLANMMRGSGILTVTAGSGGSESVRHGLGSDGEVTVEAVGSGAAFSITLSKVNHAACPSIASVLQRLADTVTVVAEGVSTPVKGASSTYNAVETEKACKDGDVNAFTFTVS